jgi:hypothetical protein
VRKRDSKRATTTRQQHTNGTKTPRHKIKMMSRCSSCNITMLHLEMRLCDARDARVCRNTTGVNKV